MTIPDFTAVTVFNGWNVMPMPLYPGFRDVEFTVNDTVAQVANPFTQQSQFQSWPGGDFWAGTLTLPKMNRASAAQWIAFLMAARGSANCFLVGDPSMKNPQGSPTGSMVANTTGSNNAAMTTSLFVSGLVALSTRNLLPGDQIQVGNRLHTCLNTVNADASGNANIGIWPSLREIPTNGEAIITNHPKGLFRLATNARTWSVDETRLFGLSFKIVEAK